MVEPRKDAPGKSEESKQPFVSQEDRPETALSSDKPVGELRVRELIEILGVAFAKNFSSEVSEYAQIGATRRVKWHIKREKPELYKELKHEKWEYYKELKLEKLEISDVYVPREFEIPNPPDPPFEQLIQIVSGLARKVDQLGNQLEGLQKKFPG